MQNIDISKLKNVKNSLTETEIFELNGILNSGEIYEKILKMQWILKEIYKNFLIKYCIIFVIIVITGIYSWFKEWRVHLVILDIIFVFILIVGVFIVWYLTIPVAWLEKGRALIGGIREKEYLSAKKEFLASISQYFSGNIYSISEKIDEGRIISSFQNHNIFGKNFSRYSLEDLFLLSLSKFHEKILVGEWREYERRRRQRGGI